MVAVNSHLNSHVGNFMWAQIARGYEVRRGRHRLLIRVDTSRRHERLLIEKLKRSTGVWLQHSATAAQCIFFAAPLTAYKFAALLTTHQKETLLVKVFVKSAVWSQWTTLGWVSKR